MTDRIEKLRARLATDGVSALLVTHPDNLRYLTGFTGSAGAALLSAGDAWFVADPRYVNQVKQQCPAYQLVATDPGVSAFEGAATLLAALGQEAVGFEKTHLTVAQFEHLQSTAPGVALVPTAGVVERLRMVKDAEELAAIRRAVEIVDATCGHILTVLRPGMTEREVALQIDWHMRRAGADKEAFDTIVASGPHSAVPHHLPTSRVLEAGDFVKLDFGAYVGGYNSDITRTVVLGKATDRQREIYAAVLEAELVGIEAARAGRQARDVDAAARESIAARGYGANFRHGLGHGLGLNIHDPGSFNPKSEMTLEPGMVMTVEPGIYIEGFGGVRIEDDVAITGGPAEVLTKSAKALTEL